MGSTRAMHLSDPATFARAYDEHGPAVYGAALRVLGNPATAQDVAQDVFLRLWPRAARGTPVRAQDAAEDVFRRLWRRPDAFDPRRGDLGAYLRLMARSRALDLWRTAHAGGRATPPLKIASARGAP